MATKFGKMSKASTVYTRMNWRNRDIDRKGVSLSEGIMRVGLEMPEATKRGRLASPP